MKVSHFNTFPYGGAATAATRIHTELNRLNTSQGTGLASQFCYYRDERDSHLDESFTKVEFAEPNPGFFRAAIDSRKQKLRQREIYRQFNEHLATRPVGEETFSMAELPQAGRLDWNSINADVVHLHWISFFADYPAFFGSIPDSVPLVWTLHDMNAFTGGCHYSDGCHNFRFGCGDCHQVVNGGPHDVSRISFDAKRNSLATKNVHVVTPSLWLKELAQKSPLWPDNTTFQTIRLGFDLEQFRPLDKLAARKQLGINSDAVLIGFGADDVNNRRKGIQHLLSVLKTVQEQSTSVFDSTPQIEGLLFGDGEIGDQAGLPRLHQMGYVGSIEQQRLIYSAADIVVVPSREDNQPQVGLEAMACGTPVVGFRAGGIPEYVRDGETGLLAELGNETDLAEKIDRLVENRALRLLLGQQARAMVEAEFELQQQTRQYLHLYESAIGYRQISQAA